MHHHLAWASRITLGMAGFTLAGALAPIEAGQDRADLLVQVRVESPCTSTLRGSLVEQRCATGTPALARIEAARASPAADDLDMPLTTISSADQPSQSYITVIY